MCTLRQVRTILGCFGASALMILIHVATAPKMVVGHVLREKFCLVMGT